MKMIFAKVFVKALLHTVYNCTHFYSAKICEFAKVEIRKQENLNLRKLPKYCEKLTIKQRVHGFSNLDHL